MNIWVQSKLRSSIMPLTKVARSLSLAFSVLAKKWSSSLRRCCRSAGRLLFSSSLRRRASWARNVEYTCQPSARKIIPPSTASRPAPARNRRCDSSGLVAIFKRTCIRGVLQFRSVLLHHPTNKSLEFALRKRPRIRGDTPFGDRRVQQRVHLATKFGFERRHKFRQTRPQSSDPHGLDAFPPGILIITPHRIDFFHQHFLR